MMERRDALKITVGSLGFALSGGALVSLMSGCKADSKTDWSPSTLTPIQFDTFSDIAETILPKTDTPGAKDAMVDRYADEAIGQYYTEEDQALFFDNLRYFDDLSQTTVSKSFSNATKEERIQIMTKAANEAGDDPDHPFNQLKSLVVSGYFTSELVCKEVLFFDPIPGPYQGCISINEVGGVNSAI